MNELVLAAKALADPTRVRVLAALRERELCVCELCDALAVMQSTLSTHLQVIREAGLVRTRKAGKWTYYAVEAKARRFLDAVFACFAPSVRASAPLRKDGQRLRRRLALRNNGACRVGFSEPKSLRKRTTK